MNNVMPNVNEQETEVAGESSTWLDDAGGPIQFQMLPAGYSGGAAWEKKLNFCSL